MIRKQSCIKPLFWCFIMLLMVVFISNSPIEAQSTGGLNPLSNIWTLGIIPGIPLNITTDDPVNFPELTGPYHIGRTFFYLEYSKIANPTNPWDLLYNELYTEDIYLPDGVTGPRKFMVWVHYPAVPPSNPDEPPAPYIPEALADAMEDEGVIADKAMFNKIHPHAYVNAQLQLPSDGDTYPVLIFSHGKNLHPLFYTTILEELASQGYIVVSIVHPHDVPASVFPPFEGYPDGTVLTCPKVCFTLTDDSFQGLEASGVPETILEYLIFLQDQEFCSIYTLLGAIQGLIGEEQTALYGKLIVAFAKMESNTNNPDVIAAALGDSTAIQTLVEYEITSRPKDVLLTLVSLVMNNGFPDLDDCLDDCPDLTMFTGHLDLTNVGMFGHSFGAGTSAWASQSLQSPSQFSPSFSATLFLDTSAVPLVLEESGTSSLSEPVMFMDGSGAEFEGDSPLIQEGDKEAVKEGSIENIDYLKQTDPFYFFELDTATHYTYVSDLMFIEPYLAGFDPYGGVPIIGIDNKWALELINTYAAAFFNKHLKNPEEFLPRLEDPDYEHPYAVCFSSYRPFTIPLCSWLYSSDPGPGPGPGPGVIPEPGTIVFFGVGLLGLLALLRRKRRG